MISDSEWKGDGMTSLKFKLCIGGAALLLFLIYGMTLFRAFRHNPVMLMLELLLLFGMIASILVISYVLSNLDRLKEKGLKQNDRNIE